MRLDWFSSTFFHLWFRWVFHTFDFCFISREKRFLNYRFDFYYMLCIPRFNYKRRKLIGQKVKIVGFSVKKLVALVINNTFRNYFERFAKNMRLHIISWWSLKPNLKKNLRQHVSIRQQLQQLCRWGRGAIQCCRLLWGRQTQLRPSFQPKSYPRCNWLPTVIDYDWRLRLSHVWSGSSQSHPKFFRVESESSLRNCRVTSSHWWASSSECRVKWNLIFFLCLFCFKMAPT